MIIWIIIKNWNNLIIHNENINLLIYLIESYQMQIMWKLAIDILGIVFSDRHHILI